jgi:peptidoglycan/xylan/chitin deacetylase (PgdA/CDA1 family)
VNAVCGEGENTDVIPENSNTPAPAVDNVPKPSGAPGNLVILDWAGFKAAVTYTFDDTQPSQIEHYDALQAEGVPMTLFANHGSASSSAGYDAAWTQAVADGHEIANHTAHHCRADLSGCTAGSALESPDAEITECTNYIIEHFGQDSVWTMASPFGDTGWNGPAEAHFFLNRGVNGGTIGPNDNTNPFNLPAMMAAGGETAEDLIADIDGVHGQGKWLIFCFHSILPTSQQWYANVELESITASMRHAKALGDVWVDTMVDIGAYWMGQKTLSAVTPTTAGADTVWTWTLPPHFPPGKYLRVTVDGGTLKQGGQEIPWSSHGYYEIALDAGSLTLSP